MRWLRTLLGGADREPAPASESSLQKEALNVYVLRVRGVFDKATMDRLQGIAAQDIARGVKDLKILIILSDFQGWRKGEDWGDLGFFLQHEASILRIGVVGDARWKEETLTFLAAGHRTGEVRFFATDQEPQAHAWLRGLLWGPSAVSGN